MGGSQRALVFVKPLNPKSSDAAKARQKSQINSHVSKFKHRQNRSNRNNAHPVVAEAPRMTAKNHQSEEWEAARVNNEKAEIVTFETQWSLDELEDIFDERTHIDIAAKTGVKHGINSNSQENEFGFDSMSRQDVSMSLQDKMTESDCQQKSNDGQANTADGNNSQAVLARMSAVSYASDTVRKHRWRTPNPWQIRSSLDPFVHLPIGVSDKEQSLLQFYLTSGRRVLNGTSERPLYCSSFEVASLALEHCPIYVRTHIAMAEHLLCIMQKSQVSDNFYRRRAEAYKAVNELILSETASFDEQLSGLLHLQMVDYTIGRPDLQRMHITAMDRLIEFRGGFSACFRSRKDTRTLVEPAIFAVQYAVAEFRFLHHACLKETVNSFIDSLKCIRVWTKNMRHQDPAGDSLAVNVIESSPLEAYISNLINSWLRPRDKPYFQAASSFHFVYALCVTLATNDFDRSATTLLLDSLQYYMEKSTAADDTGGSLNALFSGSAACMLSYVRRRFLPTHEPEHNLKREIEICQSCIAAAKIFPFLSLSARLQIARNLAKCAFVLRSRTSAELFEETDLEDLKVSVENAWATSTD